jgi:hypothetical protein
MQLMTYYTLAEFKQVTQLDEEKNSLEKQEAWY